MNVWPLRFRQTINEALIFADETGSWFRSGEAFLERYSFDQLTEGDRNFLLRNGHAFSDQGDLSYNSYAYRWMQRQAARQSLAYVMLVPTLRCNLSCTYCQVSRAAENARGYDWDDDTLNQVITFLDQLETKVLKVEFQGGEPLLRVDLLDRIRTFCRKKFDDSEFIVCTNLQNLGEQQWKFLESVDTHISTSIDGDIETHNRQRTQNLSSASMFFKNLKEVSRRFGTERLSALPTIDISKPPDFESLIAAFQSVGLSSIFLRPINYQGFARARHNDSQISKQWNKYHSDFIDFIIERNFRTKIILEEYYFTQCLKRVLMSGHDGHVDLRNPSHFATDYVVIDYDGKIYPTDESRMLSRIGHVDLSVGHVCSGIEKRKASELTASSTNNYNPDCIHCPYQPFCGSDVVDDISRYSRIDIPKADTWFCQRQLSIFDKIFELIYDKREEVKYSLAAWAKLPSWPSDLAVEHQ